MAVRIGELLLKEKRITPEQLQEALNYQRQNGGKLGYNLIKLGYVKDEEITALLSKQYGVPSINLTQFEIDPGIIKLIPSETAHKYQIVPLSRAGATLTIAMTDPTNVFAMDDIKFMTGYNVEPVVASETAVTDAITRYYPANAPAVRVMKNLHQLFATIFGTARDEDVDLYSALVGGLIDAQWANDPGGQRYGRLLDRAIDMFADDMGLSPAAAIGPPARPDEPTPRIDQE